jgi:hypothetical protein
MTTSAIEEEGLRTEEDLLKEVEEVGGEGTE